jgi:hypothetical protein
LTIFNYARYSENLYDDYKEDQHIDSYCEIEDEDYYDELYVEEYMEYPGDCEMLSDGQFWQDADLPD